jgi:hypothetical protein
MFLLVKHVIIYKYTSVQKTKNKRNKRNKISVYIYIMSILHKGVYHGGVSQRNRGISSWQAVYNMIKLPGASLSKISYSSLTGFIFRLDVPNIESNAEFYGLNDQKTALTKPIYNIVFKLAIISDDDNDILDPLSITGKNRKFNKKTENLESFRKEANTQQQIYIDTLSPNGNPITLSIIDFSYFDKRSTAVLLTELDTKHNSSTVSEMLQYIGLNIQNEQNEQHRLKNRRLGMITMELAEPTYRELADLPIGEDTYNNGCKYAIAQTLILFLKSKKLNFDSHAGNVLASTTPSKPGTVLIDFGRVLDFNNRDIYDQIKIDYNQLTGHNYDDDFDKYKSQDVTYLYESQNNPIKTVVTKMANIIQFLSYMDYIMNSINFDMKDPYDRPQIITLLQYLYGPSFSTNWGWNNNRNYVSPNWNITEDIKDRYAAIIPIIRTLTESSMNQTVKISKSAIQKMVYDGKIATFNERINEYDRSNTIQSSMTPVSPEVMERSGRTSSDNEQDDESFLKQCWGKLCGKEKKEGGRKTYRKNKRRFVHKKIITRQKKSNKQRRSSKNKRRFVHKKINTRRKKSNKQRRTSKQKRK